MSGKGDRIITQNPQRARKKRETTTCTQNLRSSAREREVCLYLAEVLPAHPEGAIVLVVLVPNSQLRAQTRAAPRHDTNDILSRRSEPHARALLTEIFSTPSSWTTVVAVVGQKNMIRHAHPPGPRQPSTAGTPTACARFGPANRHRRCDFNSWRASVRRAQASYYSPPTSKSAHHHRDSSTETNTGKQVGRRHLDRRHASLRQGPPKQKIATAVVEGAVAFRDPTPATLHSHRFPSWPWSCQENTYFCSLVSTHPIIIIVVSSSLQAKRYKHVERTTLQTTLQTTPKGEARPDIKKKRPVCTTHADERRSLPLRAAVRPATSPLPLLALRRRKEKRNGREAS